MNICTIFVFCILLLTAARVQDLPVVNNGALSLSNALSLAAQNNAALQQTRADAGAADAAARGARAQTGPGLSTTTYATTGDSSNILNTSPGVAPQNIFAVPVHAFADQNLMLMVPLLTGGRLQNTLTAARQQNEAAQFTVAASRLSVTQMVTESYASAALQAALVNAAQARLTAEDEQVRETGEKVRLGRSAPVDLLREQAEQADAQQALLAAQNGVALALVNLKATLGVSQSSHFTLSDTLETLAGLVSLAPESLPDALQMADAHRPELSAALKQVDAAQAAVRAAQSGYAPQVYGVAMADAEAGQGSGRTGYTVGLTASLPLYDGGQRRADVDAARARLERARANARQARQQIEQDTAAAWLNAHTAAAQVTAARTGLAAARESDRLALMRFEGGKSVAAERMDALSAQTRAQQSLAQAQANLVAAQAALQAALGGP